MMNQALAITLIDDCVFSARGATAGAHEGLDRIPGQAILGAAATALYAGLDLPSAFELFHSGRLRCGDAVPWVDGMPAWPMPLAWHQRKHVEADTSGWLRAGAVHNLAHDEIEHPKQLRRGYVSEAGHWVKPRMAMRMKTAIDQHSGRAQDGQLFGYEALAAGQRFVTWIQADSALAASAFEAVIGALCGTCWLGRSRSAEYGRVQIERIDLSMPEQQLAPQKRMTLWLLSDLALLDEHGQPTLEPSPAHLGLGRGRIIWSQTFLRSRSYSPWNAFRRGWDRERRVLVAGSVITLELDADPTPEMQARLAAGLGLYREGGLGRVWVNPPLLARARPDFQPRPPERNPALPPRPDDPLLAWLDDQDDSWKVGVDDTARDLANACRQVLRDARRIAGIRPGEAFGPSPSQWGSVQEAAQRATGSELHAILFGRMGGDDAQAFDGVIKSKGEGWQESVPQPGARWPTFAEWLHGQLQAHCGRRGYGRLVQALARRMRDQDVGASR